VTVHDQQERVNEVEAKRAKWTNAYHRLERAIERHRADCTEEGGPAQNPMDEALYAALKAVQRDMGLLINEETMREYPEHFGPSDFEAVVALRETRVALSELLHGAERLTEGKPVRNWDETLAEAARVLSSSEPTEER